MPQVACCTSQLVGAQQALRLFRAAPRRFDAVLTDVIMPDMSGTELLTALRQLRPALREGLC